MNNMKAFLFSKGDLVRFVSDKLTSFNLDSPWTMTIIPGKFAGYFVRIATDTVSEGTEESMQEFLKQFSLTSTETHTQAG